MSTFRYDDAFNLADVIPIDRRFMSRLSPEDWENQVQALMIELQAHGLMAPVGIAYLVREIHPFVVYGFTRTEAASRLGWTTIRANVYVDIEEKEARLLNAGDNAWHVQLTPWERAIQMKQLRESGIPVDSANGDHCLTRIMRMSRRTVFNWLRVVEYASPALHQAVKDDKVGLKHALLFTDAPLEITQQLLPECIDGQWTEDNLKLRLQMATTRPSEPDSDRATLHFDTGVISSLESCGTSKPDRATLHSSGNGSSSSGLQTVIQWLQDAASWQPPLEQQLTPAEQEKLKTGLRMVLEVIQTRRGSR